MTKRKYKLNTKVSIDGIDEVALISSKSYRSWISKLKKRYRATQIKAAIAVNSALLEFYWNLGKDISEKYAATQYYGSRFFETVSKDLTDSIPNPRGLSVVNIRYCQRFYEFYRSERNLPQLVEELVKVPWRHHRLLMDKCKGDSRIDGCLGLCKSRDKTVVEYALPDEDRPVGVAQYKLMKVPPEELRIAAASSARLTAVVDATYEESGAGGGEKKQ